MHPSKDRIVRDPLYGFIDLDLPFIVPVINTFPFQRLRWLAQTGVSSFTYPSSTHSRFSHSIGAMHVFRQIYESILSKEQLPEEEATHLLSLGCAAMLLHDIGHGPLSHLTEQPFDFNHEKVGIEVIENTDVGSILESNSIPGKKIREILNHTVTGNEAAISQLVSSELDADRLDYLVRDAYFTGVKFASIDVDRISHILTVYHEDGPINGGVVLDKKGKYSIESYILARHIMYQDVYYHKTTRAVEVLIRNALSRAREITPSKLKLPRELEFIRESAKDRARTYQDILALDDHLLYRTINEWTKSDDEVLSNLCKRIVCRDILKSIELSRDREHEYHNGLSERIAQIAVRNGFREPSYFCSTDFASETPYRPYKATSKRPEDKGKGSVITSIYLWDGKNTPDEINDISDIVKLLTSKSYSSRLYVPGSIRDEVEGLFENP